MKLKSRYLALLFFSLMLIGVTVACLSLSPPELTQEEAAQQVIDEVLNGGNGDEPMIVFSHPSPLVAGDMISAYHRSGSMGASYSKEITEATWFFWVEDYPGARFAHSNRFVFVSVAGGEITVVEENWWPVLNGTGLWVDEADYWNQDNWAYANFVDEPSGYLSPDEFFAKQARLSLDTLGVANLHEHVFPDEVGDTVICGTEDPAMDDKVDIHSLSFYALPDDGTEVQVTFVDPSFNAEDEYSWATVFYFIDQADVIKSYLWEMHIGEFTSGEVDPTTFEVIDPDITFDFFTGAVPDSPIDQMTTLSLSLPKDVYDFSDIYAVGVQGFHTEGEDSDKNCDNIFEEVTPEARQPKKPGKAIIINGWKPGEKGKENFEEDVKGMHNSLGKNAGFDTWYYGPQFDGSPKVNGEASHDDLSNWFHHMRDVMQPGETLFVYITSHGEVNDEGVGELGDISEETMEIWLGGFQKSGVNVVFVADGCEAGSFNDRMNNVANVSATSTGDSDPSYGDIDDQFVGHGWVKDPNPNDKGGEFTSGLVEGLNKILTDPEAKMALEEQAKNSGENFWNALLGKAYVHALENDVAYLSGKTFPNLVRQQPE